MARNRIQQSKHELKDKLLYGMGEGPCWKGGGGGEGEGGEGGRRGKAGGGGGRRQLGTWGLGRRLREPHRLVPGRMCERVGSAPET